MKIAQCKVCNKKFHHGQGPVPSTCGRKMCAAIWGFGPCECGGTHDDGSPRMRTHKNMGCAVCNHAYERFMQSEERIRRQRKADAEQDARDAQGWGAIREGLRNIEFGVFERIEFNA